MHRPVEIAGVKRTLKTLEIEILKGRSRPFPDVRVAIELGPYQAEIVQSDTFAIALVIGASESLKRLHQHQYKFLIGGVILAAAKILGKI